MKKIDRYVARAYILRFLLAHFVIFGLYVSFDLMQRVDMFYEAGAEQTFSQLLLLYLYQLPSNIMHTVPPLLMLSAGLVLVYMNRNGELLTLKASGISVQRICMPLFIVTIPVVIMLGIAQETILPDLYRQRNVLENQIEGREAGPFLLTDRQNEELYELFVGNYNFQEGIMTDLTLLTYHEGGQVVKKILEADSAHWANSKIKFNRASLQEFNPRGELVGDPEAFETKTWATDLTLSDFIDAQEDVLTTRAPAMTLSGIKQRIDENPHNPRFRVLFHSRIADNFTAIILLLLGLPMLVGYGNSHQSRLVGALIAMIIMGIYYILVFIFLSIGNAALLPAALAAWLIPGMGMLLGMFCFSSMRT